MSLKIKYYKENIVINLMQIFKSIKLFMIKTLNNLLFALYNNKNTFLIIQIQKHLLIKFNKEM